MSPIKQAWGAALAIAVLAPAAVADTHHFTTHNGEPVELTAEALETQVMSLGGDSEFECPLLIIAGGTVIEGGSQITAEPAGDKEIFCSMHPIGTPPVDTNGCHYLFTGDTDETDHAAVHITGCDEGSPGVQIVAGVGCTITFPEQEMTGMAYEKAGATPEEDIVLTPTLDNIEYDLTSTCAFFGLEDKDDGTYAGNVTLTGWEDNGSEAGHGEEQRGLGYVTTED